MNNVIIESAWAYLDAKLSVFPAKMPSKKAAIEWKKFQTEFMKPSDFELIARGLDGNSGIAICCGAISGNLEVIDFDNKINTAKDVFVEWAKKPEVNKILLKYSFPVETTISGGFHVFYKCEKLGHNAKLARAENPNEPGTIETIIETRGEGGYVVIAPTPGYKLKRGKFTNIPIITEEERETLLSACMMFNEYFGNYTKSKEEATAKKSSRVGDMFNTSDRAPDIVTKVLIENGYTYMENKGDSMFFRRPGKKGNAISCCYNGKTMYVWSTNCTPFESERAYSNFYIFAYLKHNMDFKAAAKDLAEMGFVPEETPEEKKKKEDRYHHFLKIIKGEDGLTYQIDYRLYIEFLAAAGFRRYDQKTDFVFVRIQNKIVEQVYVHNIVTFVLSHFKGDELNFITKSQKQIVKKEQLACLPIFNDKFNTDTKSIVYAYFKDQFVEITDNQIETKDYEDLKNCIWKDQILQHCINIDSEQKTSDFHKFIQNITTFDNTPERYFSLISAIGYMCSRYKTPSTPKVLVLCDEGDSKDIDPNASKGGTGKSLICKAISHFRRTEMINGKAFKFDNQFKWQKIKEDTNVIWFDETSKWFPFDKLFSVITDDIEVEAKNQPSFTIPFERSPKFMLATNFTIPDQSLSTKRRIHEVELAPFYNESHQPKDDFEKEFFTDWDDSEWRDFYSLIFSAIQLYLQKGLIKYVPINLNERKLAQLVDDSFQEYFFNWLNEQQKDLEGNYNIMLTEFYNAYMNTSHAIKGMTSTKCTQNIKNILDFKNIQYVNKKSGAKRVIIFKVNEDSNLDTFIF